MVLLIVLMLVGLPFLIPALRRNNFYFLHVGLVTAAAWYVENKYFPEVDIATFVSKWRSVMMIFAVLHLISINLVTFMAYGVDKRAAQNGSWRVPESQLHSLEFMGGWCGAIIGQKFFHHKTKKESYQAFFWALLFLEVVIVWSILKYMHFI